MSGILQLRYGGILCVGSLGTANTISVAGDDLDLQFGKHLAASVAMQPLKPSKV